MGHVNECAVGEGFGALKPDTFELEPGSSATKESACNAGDPGLIPGSGRLSPFLIVQLVKNPPAMQETLV